MFFLLASHAQEPTEAIPAATATQIPASATQGKVDYSLAFQKLIALGFPDAKGASYIKLKFAKTDREQGRSDSYYNNFELKRDGDAWLLPEKDPKSPAREIIHEGFLVTKVAAKEKRNLIVRLFAGDDDKTRNGLRKAEWIDIDPAKEVAEILAQLETAEAREGLFDRDTWSYDQSALSTLGELLMMACHLHQSGHPGEAHKLANTILTNAPYPFKVIDQVVDQLASSEYRNLLDQLYTTRDWQAYLKGIRDLSAKYPRGWSDHPGLKILIHQVASHVRTAQKEITPFKGLPLDPEILKTLDQLYTPAEGLQSVTAIAPSCWVFNPANDLESEYGNNGSITPAVASIVSQGMAAFPTLIAASAEPTLIPASFQRPQSGSRRTSYDFINGETNALDLEQSTYRKMDRPCTRGEIARSIILQTLPAGNTNWDSLSPEEFQLFAHDWWLAHKEKPFAQIAISFLKGGDDEQQSLALQAIMQSDDESAFPLIESFILESDSLLERVELVQKYLKRRRSKGREFHDTYLTKLREEFDTRFGEQGNSEQIEDYFKKTTSALAVLVDDISPDKIMAEISSGKRTAEEGFPLLAVAIGEGAYLKNLGTILPFINELQEPSDRLTGLANLQRWIYQSNVNAEEPAPEGEPLTDHQKNLRELASAHLETWQKFLARTDTLTIPAKQLVNYQSPPSEAHYAAMIMAGIHFPEANGSIRELSQVASSDELWNLHLEQMTTFAKTNQAPVPPRSNNVPAEQKDAILAKVKGLPTSEIIAYRKSLNLSERLALVEMLASLEEIPAQIQALSTVCQNINWTRASDIPADLRTKIESAIINQPISDEMVRNAFEVMSQEEAGIVLIFQPAATSLSGPRILAWSTRSSNGWLENQIPGELEKLDLEKAPRLESIIAFGINEESREAITATRYLPSADPAKDKASFEDLLKQVYPLFEPSDEDERRLSQVGFALATETYTGFTSTTEVEEENE
ncbi:hypothetical protein V2O64_00160 [Verrucomicrobiaceae bacterium 227]